MKNNGECKRDQGPISDRTLEGNDHQRSWKMPTDVDEKHEAFDLVR